MTTLLKKICIGCIVLLLSIPCSGKTVQAMLSYASFWSPASKSYLETYLAVAGNSISFVKNASGKYQGTIEITMIFKQKNVVMDYKKLNLLSPEIDDSLKADFNFIDQQRFVLAPGVYDFEISIIDLNKKEAKFTTNDKISIFFSDSKVNLSGTELIESFKPTSETNILSKST